MLVGHVEGSNTRKVVRDSSTGQFVKAEEATTRPTETQAETFHAPSADDLHDQYQKALRALPPAARLQMEYQGVVGWANELQATMGHLDGEHLILASIQLSNMRALQGCLQLRLDALPVE